MGQDKKLTRIELRQKLESEIVKQIKSDNLSKLENLLGGFKKLLKWINKEAPRINKRDFLIVSPAIIAACTAFKTPPKINYHKLQKEKIQAPEYYNGTGGCFHGYFGGTPGFFESVTGKKPSVSYTDLYGGSTVEGGVSDVLTFQMEVRARYGAIPFVSYSVSEHGRPLDLILSGKTDHRIKKSAILLRKFGESHGGFFIRTLREFNLFLTKYSGDPKKAKAVFIKIWDIFEKEGANEYATWVWNPYVGIRYSPWEPYYPGNKYVDWIGLNAYNWGNTYPNTSQRSVKSLFNHAYRKISSKHPDKPIMIAECGSVENSSKAKWFQGIDWIKQTNIKAVMFWHDYWRSRGGKKIDSRLDSSVESLEAFKKAISDPHFLTPVKYRKAQ